MAVASATITTPAAGHKLVASMDSRHHRTAHLSNLYEVDATPSPSCLLTFTTALALQPMGDQVPPALAPLIARVVLG